MEILMPQACLVISTTTLDHLVKKFSSLLICDLTRTQKIPKVHDSQLDMTGLSNSESKSGASIEDPSHFSLRLKNLASAYQESIQHLMQSAQEIPLIGAEQGLVLSITAEGCIVH